MNVNSRMKMEYIQTKDCGSEKTKEQRTELIGLGKI